MENNAATLQSMYRDTFETDIAKGNDFVSAKRQRRDGSPFASIDQILRDLDSLDETGANAA